MPSHALPSRSNRCTTLSTHPKTILNRTYEANKDALERAFGRDNAAFRKAKSRRLTVFRSSQQWKCLSEKDRERAEQKIIDSLIAVRDAKKREHEMEWRRKVEAGEEVEEKGEDNSDDNEGESVGNIDTDDEWVDEDSDDVDENKNNGMQDFARSMSEIKKLWGKKYWEKVAEVERKAKKRENEYKEFIDRRQ